MSGQITLCLSPAHEGIQQYSEVEVNNDILTLQPFTVPTLSTDFEKEFITALLCWRCFTGFLSGTSRKEITLSDRTVLVQSCLLGIEV